MWGNWMPKYSSMKSLFGAVFAISLCNAFNHRRKDLPKNFTEFEDRPPRNTCTYEIMEDCPQTSFKFPNVVQDTNYVRVKTPIPDLDEFTMCGWFTRYTHGYDIWISYANEETSDAIIFLIPTDYVAVLIINGDEASTNSISLDTNVEYYICIATFAASTGRSYIFVNGELAAIFEFTPSIVKGEGVFILGQNQQQVGGDFHPGQSSQGKLSNFMLWEKVFEFDDYQHMYNFRCSCPPNFLFSLENPNVEIFGGASAVNSHICPY